MEITFTKLSGAGNDFVALDNQDGHLTVDRGDLARALCDRHFGVGADGILIIDKSSGADFRMSYYNADGSTGGMCGNGGRCAVRYVQSLGSKKQEFRFEAVDHVYGATVAGTTIRLQMKDPVAIQRGIRVRLEGSPYTVHAIDTGAPHVVHFVDDLETVDVVRIGRLLREHERFSPGGTNVNFVQLLDRTTIAIRTYERGVEAETLACGTGSIAAGIMAHLERAIYPPIRVRARSGEWLSVSFAERDGTFTDVILEGGADIVFTGTTLYDPLKVRLRGFQNSPWNSRG